MKFIKTTLHGVYLIHLEPIEDERGFFARSWCQREFALRGLSTIVSQCNISFNRKCGTLRGMHYQASPYEEVKLVQCIRGSIFDVVIDLRLNSSTYQKWESVKLTATNKDMLYIPTGFAHGFQTLENNTEVFYQMSKFYCPDASRGIRWNDPKINIQWPLPNPILSDKDAQYPLLS